mgnify:CR=1 FL=1
MSETFVAPPAARELQPGRQRFVRGEHMNAQSASNTHVWRWTSAVVALLLAAPGWAQSGPPKPRVQIIFDTSTSMKVAPVDPFSTPIQMTDPGGDFDTNNQGLPCTSKFCIAKKVVYNTLPQFAGEARIGLASYYQFLVKYETDDTRYTRCYYDKMFKPGYVGPETRFTSPVDLTGSGTTFPSVTATELFPSGSGSGAKNGRCLDTANGANRYLIRKTNAITTNHNCAVYEYPSDAVPMMFASPAPSGTGTENACNTSLNYTSKSAMPVVVNQTATPSVGGIYTVKYVAPSTATCPTQNMLSGSTPMGMSPETLAAPPTIGTAVGNWEGLNANECTSSSPCTMFSASSMPQQTTANQRAYSLKASAYVPATPPANLVSATHTYGGVVTGNPVTFNNTASCPYGPLMNVTSISDSSRNWNYFGITTGMVEGAAGAGSGSAINPGWTNPVCNSNYPCDVRLVSEALNPTTFSTSTVNYHSPVGTGQTTTPLPNLTNSGNYFRRMGSCGGNLLLSSAAVVGGAGNWVPGHVPAGCNAGLSRCSMIPVGSTTMSNGCSAVTKYDNSGTPPACTGLDGTTNNYGAPTDTVFSYTLNLPNGSSCPTNGSMRTGPEGPSNQCPAGFSCAVHNNPTASAGPAETSPTRRNRTTPPPGYSGVPTTTTNLSTISACSGTTGTSGCAFSAPPASCQMGVFETNDAALCGAGNAPCTVEGVGLQNYGVPVDENQPKRCMYLRKEFTWSRPTVNCNIQVRRRVYPVNGTMNVCRYEMQQFQLNNPNPPSVTCRYSAPTARHQYSVVNNKWCQYYRMKTVFTAQTYNYHYEYTTKGGELVTRRSTSGGTNNSNAPWISSNEFYRTVDDQQICTENYNDATGFAGGHCPPVIDNCNGNANHVCKLRWGRPQDNAAGGSGRYALAISRNSSMCVAPDFDAAATWYTATPSYNTMILPAARFSGGGTNSPSMSGALAAAGDPLAFATACQQDGAPAAATYRLFSDWYQPGVSNGASPTNATVGPLLPGTVTRSWNNQATKESGWSGIGGDGTLFPAGIPTSPAGNFVPIPDDTDPSGGQAALNEALGLCELPNATTVDPMTFAWNKKGMCMVSDYFRNGPPEIKDFTPLKGSLQNAADYLMGMRDHDIDRECRDYFVVLATDGLENSPAAFTDPDLVSTVASMKSHVPTGYPTNTTGIRTYVIGFGDLVSGSASASLDAMAAAGGTGSAFTASDQASLQTALSLVLTQITSGTFSRSKPSLSTDGQRIYAGNFQRGLGASASPEWQGFLRAYAIDPTTGALSEKWEYSQKLNAVADNTRVLKTEVAGTTYNFSSSVSQVRNAIEAGIPLPMTVAPISLDGTDVIDFVRNPGVPSNSFQDYISILNPKPKRLSRAGAIEHSSAVVVGRSGFGPDWGGTTATQRTEYQQWQARTKPCAPGDTPGTNCRPLRILVGGSEGMLHAIEDRADTTANPTCATDEMDPACPNGHEKWGWVPSSQLPELYRTMMSNQKNVDNTMAVTDVCGTISGSWPSANSGDSASCDDGDWFTMGIGSLREGGRSLFALKIQDDGTPAFMWNFNHSDLGTTWSIPIIARIRYNGEDKFAAVFGGGMQCATCGSAGDSMYVLDALTGSLIRRYNSVGGGSNSLPGRPAMFRRPANPYLDTVVIGGKTGSLYEMRFANTSAAQQDNDSFWTPSRFFDPEDPNDAPSTLGVATPIQTIVRTPAWDAPPGMTPPSYTLSNANAACGTPSICPVATVTTLPLPGGTAPPIYNRPKVGTVVDGSGNLGDYYVGTGDVENPGTPAWNTNYIYALHDKNEQLSSGQHDGVPLWVVRLPHRNEQIVSEPVLVSGALVVATYIPPTASSSCALAGDTVLYSFDPKGGTLVPTLITPANQPGAGTKTAVVKLDNFGIPSDLVAYKGNIAVNGSQGGITTLGFQPPTKGGDIRSFRRIR